MLFISTVPFFNKELRQFAKIMQNVTREYKVVFLGVDFEEIRTWARMSYKDVYRKVLLKLKIRN